jgi:hypothetical protein
LVVALVVVADMVVLVEQVVLKLVLFRYLLLLLL